MGWSRPQLAFALLLASHQGDLLAKLLRHHFEDVIKGHEALESSVGGHDRQSSYPPRAHHLERLVAAASAEVFAGQKVGVKQTDDHLCLVTFMDYDLGYFDDETCRLEPIDNPFGPKLLPMSPE